MGACDKLTDPIQKMDAPWHIVMFILNIVWSGLGSIINSFGVCGGSKFEIITFVIGLI